eukprot:CAMPEP_0182920016 /NCGR_PEP_ID=MMETSP0105_2-20130417/3153_1 /TAXON_ID=81532 ORGANISM="Acanthoeca-like sp., Strain 10tr" /NCGR_SAMPLE_ID=MMETSP0105_2 /ASSEMBLY_ACC=CAM_ASM_000205 /LENGTH=863 /DNA_ID=CAMNT_0025057331 /DNA_START=31 /DNA_END=2622 /DNA_ORIENTATION=-
MGITGLDRFLKVQGVGEEITLKEDDERTIVIDAKNFQGVIQDTVRAQLCDSGLWKFGGGYRTYCAEANRCLDILAKCTKKIIIVKDGVAPMAKAAEKARRRQDREAAADVLGAVICHGPVDKLDAIHPSGHVRWLHEWGEECGNWEAHPDGCLCQDGVWCPRELCDVKVHTTRTGSMWSRFRSHCDQLRAEGKSAPEVLIKNADTEGDDWVARYANEFDGLILSNDTDMAIFDTPHGYLDLRSTTFNDNGTVVGTVHHPRDVAAALSQISKALPTGSGAPFELEHLPTFAALAGNDITKTLFNGRMQQEASANELPCVHVMKRGRCAPRDGKMCYDCHDVAMIKAHYPCYWDASNKSCRIRDKPYHCAHDRMSCATLADGNKPLMWHLVVGRTDRSTAQGDAMRIGRFAVIADIAASKGQRGGKLEKLLHKWRAYDREHSTAVVHRLNEAVDFYNLAAEAFERRNACLAAVRQSHSDTVWDSRKKKPHCDEVTRLVTRVENLDAYKSDSAADFPTSVYASTAKLRLTQYQIDFFWNASEPMLKWDKEYLHHETDPATPQLETPDDWEAFDEGPDFNELPDTVTVYEQGVICRPVVVKATGGALPMLTAEQMTVRPWIQHLSKAEARSVLLRASSLPQEEHYEIVKKIEDWTAAGRDVFESQYPHTAPQLQVVALRMVTITFPDITDDELLAIATLIVCACDDNLYACRQVAALADGPPQFTQSCWRQGCTLPSPESVDTSDCCTPTYRRRQYIVDLFDEVSSELGYLNGRLEALCSTAADGGDGPVPVAAGEAAAGAAAALVGASRDRLEEPFSEGCSRLYTDELSLHAVLLMEGGAKCSCEAHVTLAARLVNIARRRDVEAP